MSEGDYRIPNIYNTCNCYMPVLKMLYSVLFKEVPSSIPYTVLQDVQRFFDKIYSFYNIFVKSRQHSIKFYLT